MALFTIQECRERGRKYLEEMASRVAKIHSTEEELRVYMEEHPTARRTLQKVVGAPLSVGEILDAVASAIRRVLEKDVDKRRDGLTIEVGWGRIEVTVSEEGRFNKTVRMRGYENGKDRWVVRGSVYVDYGVVDWENEVLSVLVHMTNTRKRMTYRDRIGRVAEGEAQSWDRDGELDGRGTGWENPDSPPYSTENLGERFYDGAPSYLQANGGTNMDRMGMMAEKVAKGLVAVDANKEYAVKMKEVRGLLKELDKRLERHEILQGDRIDDRGFVGDIGHVREELKSIVNSLGV